MVCLFISLNVFIKTASEIINEEIIKKIEIKSGMESPLSRTAPVTVTVNTLGRHPITDAKIYLEYFILYAPHRALTLSRGIMGESLITTV